MASVDELDNGGVMLGGALPAQPPGKGALVGVRRDDLQFHASRLDGQAVLPPNVVEAALTSIRSLRRAYRAIGISREQADMISSGDTGLDRKILRGTRRA